MFFSHPIALRVKSFLLPISILFASINHTSTTAIGTYLLRYKNRIEGMERDSACYNRNQKNMNSLFLKCYWLSRPLLWNYCKHAQSLHGAEHSRDVW